MADVFISYAEEDIGVVLKIAEGLEAAGYTTWHYSRDSVPGLAYLIQVGQAIDEAKALLLVISPHSLDSHQVTNEVVRAYEAKKPFIPVLADVTHDHFQKCQPVLRQCLGAATSVRIPSEGASAIVPRITAGLAALRICPSAPPRAESAREPAGAPRTNSLGNTLVAIPDDRLPRGHEPRVSLYVSSTCVTNREYLDFVRDGGPEPEWRSKYRTHRQWVQQRGVQENPDHPVIFVSHEQAESFCQWLTERERLVTGERYTLPSFEQWRAVARASPVLSTAVTDRSWRRGEPPPTDSVTSGDPDPLGLYCMFGNVFEWCAEGKLRNVTREGRVVSQRYSLTIGGGWASSRSWLREQIQKGTYGGIYCPDGWPMKDGGFRLWLVSESAADAVEAPRKWGSLKKRPSPEKKVAVRKRPRLKKKSKTKTMKKK